MIVTTTQMKTWEKSFVDRGHGSFLTLATNAAHEVVRVVLEPTRHRGRPVVVLCGEGNNGADGYLVALELHENGHRVSAIPVLPPRSPLCIEAHERAAAVDGLVIADADERAIGEGCIVVDAVYGTGFHGALPPEVTRMFDAVRAALATVVSVDIPSGVAADTGVVADGTLAADVTVALAARKPAHVLKPSSVLCGEIEERPIGLLEYAVERTIFATSARRTCAVAGCRDTAAHKGAFGRVLVIAGSRLMPGAALLATKAALRSGAGLTTLASCDNVRIAAATFSPEATHCNSEQQDDLLERLRRADACVIGCGLGTDDRALALLRLALTHAVCPLVLDADALTMLAKHRDLLRELSERCVLTPHIGEMVRLTGHSVDTIVADRIGTALKFACEYGVTVALKSASTVVASPAGRIHVNATGHAGLAKGGSGDVLAGITGALLARSDHALDETAAAACWLLGQAADALLPDYGDTTLLASDVIDRGLPRAFASLP